MLSCALGSSAHAGSGYQLGRGYDVGPFNIAGYSDIVANLPSQEPRSLVLDDLSLFVTGKFGRLFNPFVEAELADLAVLHSGTLPANEGDGEFVVERLYNDSYLTDSLTLRLGKMLTPVGEWNEIHAAPLVLTTVRPAVTHRNFSEYATGVSLLYSDPYARFADVQVYWQPSEEFSERPSNLAVHRYDRVFGAHVSFPFGLLDKIGASFQRSRDVRGVQQSLFGLDFHYSLAKLTLQGEATVSDIADSAAAGARDIEWGAYAAAAYALTDSWSVHGWYEVFADRQASAAAQDVLLGVAYRPQPAMVFRLEYLQNVGGEPVNPTGLFGSWSVLF